MNTQVQNNYTGYGWEGKNYQNTKGLSTKEIARKIKGDIKKEFPIIKISVHSDYFLGGSSIEVTVTDFGFDPLTEQFKEYLKTDKSLSFRNWCDGQDVPDTKYQAEALDILKKIEAIGDSYNYSDTDSQIDYFDTKYYFTVDC